jgi:hypothetical protein
MLHGKTLQELAIEIERQENSKKDLIVNPKHMSYNDGRLSVVRKGDSSSWSVDFDGQINRNFESQLTTYLDIPDKYFQMLRTENHKDLADTTINTLLGATTAPRMVRTLDGTARAFLSDRYRRIDNYQILSMALPIINDIPGIKVESCEVTENKLYLKVVNPRLEREISVGDNVQAGMVLSNSEIGRGSLSVMPLMYRLVCLNGMVINDAGNKTYHIGSQQEQGNLEMYSDDTLRSEDKTLMLKLRDIVRAISEAPQFDRVVNIARERKAAMFTNSPVAVATNASKVFGLNKDEGVLVLENFISNRDYSIWGLANAITQSAQSLSDYDRSTELETVGYRVMTMEKPVYKMLCEGEVA